MQKQRKKSLLGPHSADDDEYWEHYTDGIVMPRVKDRKQETSNPETLKLPPELKVGFLELLTSFCSHRKVMRFERGEMPGEYVVDTHVKHNQLRKNHLAPPVILTRELCGLAKGIAYEYAKSRKHSSGPSSKPEGRMYAGVPCTETLIFQEGIPGTTYLSGYEASQKAYECGYRYNYDGIRSTRLDPFFNMVWRNVTHLGVGKITVLTPSVKHWFKTCQREPIERTYIVFLYYPPIEYTAQAILQNVVQERRRSILKNNSSSPSLSSQIEPRHLVRRNTLREASKRSQQ